jgi:hypothetical protein
VGGLYCLSAQGENVSHSDATEQQQQQPQQQSPFQQQQQAFNPF